MYTIFRGTKINRDQLNINKPNNGGHQMNLWTYEQEIKWTLTYDLMSLLYNHNHINFYQQIKSRAISVTLT
jgi:hypothetical protein